MNPPLKWSHEIHNYKLLWEIISSCNRVLSQTEALATIREFESQTPVPIVSQLRVNDNLVLIECQTTAIENRQEYYLVYGCNYLQI